MKNKFWKTVVSFSAVVALTTLLHPSLSSAGQAGGWDCISANKETYFNFLEPKLGPRSSSHVLQVGGYDGFHIHSTHPMDFTSYGTVTATHFNVKVSGPWDEVAYQSEVTLGILEGKKDANGRWQVLFSRLNDGTGYYEPIPLTCTF